jgi:hypothetical protein
VKLNLTIEVKKVSYSGVEMPSTTTEAGAGMTSQPTTASASSGGASLHLSGQISKQNEHVKLGAFHTLDLEPEREFTIIKGPDGWDSLHVQRLADATDASKSAEVGAILADDSGRATICLIGAHTTLIKQRIEVPLSKAKKPGQASDKSLDKYYKQIYDAVVKHFNFSLLRMVIIASPGLTKDAVFEAIFSQAVVSAYCLLIFSQKKTAVFGGGIVEFIDEFDGTESEQQGDPDVQVQVPADLHADDPSAIAEPDPEHAGDPEPAERHQVFQGNPGAQQVPEDDGGGPAPGSLRRGPCRPRC